MSLPYSPLLGANRHESQVCLTIGRWRKAKTPTWHRLQAGVSAIVG